MLVGNLGSEPLTRLSGRQPSGASVIKSESSVASETPAIRKLRKAAQEFEGQLIASWWRSMKDSALTSSDDDGPSGVMSEMGIQAMSQAIASAGGLGLASILVRYLQPMVNAESGSRTGQSFAAPLVGSHRI
jgi:Rod binding domain-containing protein